MARIDPHSFDSVYLHDITNDFMGRLGDNKLARYTLGAGYLMTFAFESNLRAAMYREVALRYPGFKTLMNSPEMQKLAKEGIPELGFKEVSPFQATFRALSDPQNTRFYDPNFMPEVKYTADGVMGNYRDFSKTERTIRNYLVPFYAWQRHSALYTYRLFKERPLQLNAFYQLGNYGFDRTVANGGTLPEWAYESVPMPSELVNILQMDPTRDNRINLSSINPFSTFTATTTLAANMFGGQSFVQSAGNVFDMLNPFISTAVANQTGVDPRTGIPLTKDEKNKGMIEAFLGTFESFPAIARITNGFKSDIELNQLRGKEDPMDVFVDPTNPESKLSVPKDKLNQKFNTLSPAGLFNAFAPVKALSLDPEAMVANYKKQAAKRGIKLSASGWTDTALQKHTKALVEWKRMADWIQHYWIPAYGKQYPDVAQRVMAELSKEMPDLPKNYPPELYAQVMGGGTQ
jgi:hypothetical protein